ncbi:hypothetical protein [Microbispora sp. H10836]|uniref:hypothetical protein n=1 Tax=Microbispora sp. H10836 TaxID=2729106 RepID=UPI001475B38A|nr:hypothetical protein [Microbispora sp. H10836]
MAEKSQKDLFADFIRVLTIATNRGERSTAEITSDIAIANQVSGVKLMFPASTPLEELLRHVNDTLRAPTSCMLEGTACIWRWRRCSWTRLLTQPGRLLRKWSRGWLSLLKGSSPNRNSVAAVL